MKTMTISLSASVLLALFGTAVHAAEPARKSDEQAYRTTGSLPIAPSSRRCSSPTVSALSSSYPEKDSPHLSFGESSSDPTQHPPHSAPPYAPGYGHAFSPTHHAPPAASGWNAHGPTGWPTSPGYGYPPQPMPSAPQWSGYPPQGYIPHAGQPMPSPGWGTPPPSSSHLAQFPVPSHAPTPDEDSYEGPTDLASRQLLAYYRTITDITMSRIPGELLQATALFNEARRIALERFLRMDELLREQIMVALAAYKTAQPVIEDGRPRSRSVGGLVDRALHSKHGQAQRALEHSLEAAEAGAEPFKELCTAMGGHYKVASDAQGKVLDELSGSKEVIKK